MTVSSTTSRWEYTGDGVTTAFTVNNTLFAEADLLVYLGGTLKTIGTHYTVSVNADQDASPGGTVLFLTAPALAAAVVIVREVENTQDADFPVAGPFPSETVEDAFDRRTMVTQQIIALLGRTLRFPVSDAAALTSELSNAAARAGKFLGFDSSGNVALAAVALGDALVSPFIETLIDDADAATARTTLGVGEPIRSGGTAGGTVNALTCTCSPVLTALTDGAIVVVRASGANTSTTVTFAPDGLTAKNVKLWGNKGLYLGVIFSAAQVLILRYNAANDVWELLNPKQPQLWGIDQATTATGVDTITATVTPSPSLYNGAMFRVRAAGANATTAPTINISSTGAKTITKLGGVALSPGDIWGAGHELLLVYSSASDRIELLNPAPAELIIARGTATAVAALDFTGLVSTFRAYKLTFDNLAPASDGVSLWLLTDTNNGASFEAGASDYAWQQETMVAAVYAAAADLADAQIVIGRASSFGTGTDEVCAGEITIHNPMHATSRTRISYSNIGYNNSTPAQELASGVGQRLAQEANNAIRLMFSTGNIATINYTLKGIR